MHSRIRDRLGQVQARSRPRCRRPAAAATAGRGRHPRRPAAAHLPAPPPAVRPIRSRRAASGPSHVAHLKAIDQARDFIYVEDQYLWSSTVTSAFAEALRANPRLHLVAVLPHRPDLDGMAELDAAARAGSRRIASWREAGPGTVRGIRHREPLRLAGLRPRQGRRHRRLVRDHRLRQHQPALVDPRLRAGRARHRRRGHRPLPLRPLAAAAAGGRAPRPAARRARARRRHGRLRLGLGHVRGVCRVGVCSPGSGTTAASSARVLPGACGPSPSTRSAGGPERALEVPQRLLGDPDGRPRQLRTGGPTDSGPRARGPRSGEVRAASADGTTNRFGRDYTHGIWFRSLARQRVSKPRAVAQLGSALDWGSRGRRFKSCQPDRRTCRSEGVPGKPEAPSRRLPKRSARR